MKILMITLVLGLTGMVSAQDATVDAGRADGGSSGSDSAVIADGGAADNGVIAPADAGLRDTAVVNDAVIAPVDSGTPRADTGTTPPAASGGCSVGGNGSSGLGLLGLGLGLALISRKRRA